MSALGYGGIWGWADGYGDLCSVLAAASGVIVGTNPPYSLTDFFSLFPKFGGTPIVVTGTVDGTTGTITGVSSIAGLLAGQYVSGVGIAPGSVIVSAIGTTVVLNLPTIQAGSPVQLTVYVAPLVPTAVLNAYIYLATSSIIQARWLEMWMYVMGLFIAHYATLWLLGEASGPNATGAQAAASGLAQGIVTSESAGDVSYSSQVLNFDKWGTFGLTLYGQEFATLAQAVGSGNMLFI